jgi:hypothetical protein
MPGDATKCAPPTSCLSTATTSEAAYRSWPDTNRVERTGKLLCQGLITCYRVKTCRGFDLLLRGCRIRQKRSGAAAHHSNTNARLFHRRDAPVAAAQAYRRLSSRVSAAPTPFMNKVNSDLRNGSALNRCERSSQIPFVRFQRGQITLA